MTYYSELDMKTKTKLIFIIALILAVLLAAIPVNAQTITMANPDGTATRDIMVYWPNGTLYGLYNDTSIITTSGDDSYIFTLKPQGNSIIDDPGDWLTNYAFPFVKTNIIAILLIFAALGLLASRR
jgi:hypothetical protein